MKINYITLSILILIILISCSIIVFQLNKNRVKRELMEYDEKLMKLVVPDLTEHFYNEEENDPNNQTENYLIDRNILTESSFANSLLISKITVLSENNPNNEFKNKVLYIKGKNLDKIVDVFFGDIKGIILNRNTINVPVESKAFTMTNEEIQQGINDITRRANEVLAPDTSSSQEAPAPDTSSSQDAPAPAPGDTVEEFSNLVTETELYVLPPDFGKYGANLTVNDLKNIEIKFLIHDPKQLENPGASDLTMNNIPINEFINGSNNMLNINSELNIKIVDKPLISQYYNKLLRVRLTLVLQKTSTNSENRFKLKLNDSDNTTFDVDLSEGTKVMNMIINIRNFIIPKISFEKENEQQNIFNFKIKRAPMIDYMFNDINTLFPTGLFYRIGTSNVTSGTNLLNLDKNDWSIFLQNREDNNCRFLSKEVRDFYRSVRSSLGIEDEENVPKQAETNYSVENLEIKIDENDDTQIIANWSIPDTVVGPNFTFLFNFEPKSGLANDTFKIVNEKLAFDKTSFTFSNKRLIPTSKYDVTIKTLKYKPNMKIMGETKVEFSFVPSGLEFYHKHLFRNGKFRFEETTNNPELVKTYYQLSAYNKQKTQDDLIDTQEKIEGHAKCMDGYLNNVKNSSFSSSFDSSFSGLSENDIEEENKIFSKKQSEQSDVMSRINSKIAELEKLKNIKEEDVTIKIKSLKSIENGTVLRLKDIGDDNKLVLLNNGCLAFSRTNGKDEYGYIPCNHIDSEQKFRITKITDLDEYNDLLAQNIQPLIPKTRTNITYPFYILQPISSEKCVSIKKEGLSIEPCSEENFIRFNGYMDNSDCNV
jgi:hypothetical protein